MGIGLPPNTETCDVCKHYRGMRSIHDGATLEPDYVNYCAAFPDEIPEEILSGENNHIKPLPDQGNKIVFEPKE